MKDELSASFEALSIMSKDGVELEGMMYEPEEFDSTMLYFTKSKSNLKKVINELSYKYKNKRIISFGYRFEEDKTHISDILKKHYGDIDGV